MIALFTLESYGTFLAFYEHKVFVQGILLKFNFIDKSGVELGEQLGDFLLSVIGSEEGKVAFYFESEFLLIVLTKFKGKVLDKSC